MKKEAATISKNTNQYVRKLLYLAIIFPLLTTIVRLNDISAQTTGRAITLTPDDNSATTIVARGCNTNTPGWGSSLGIVSFATDSTWTITNGTITQVWSDAVTATNCNKTMFDGGHSGRSNFNADCRSNPNQKGDLFSWCAVMRFAEQLCPYPWRVPSHLDFISLDRAMGGTGSNQVNKARLVSYVGTGANQWAGVYGGYCRLNTAVISQGSWAYYWSSSEGNHTASARNLNFGTNGVIYLQNNGENSKSAGFALRCVR